MTGTRRLTEKEFCKKYENFTSQDLLTAVGHFDQLRYIMADKDDLEPPESRQQLLKLHQRFFAICGYGTRELDVEDTYSVIDQLEDVIYDIQEHCDKLSDILQNLQNTLPEPGYDD